MVGGILLRPAKYLFKRCTAIRSDNFASSARIKINRYSKKLVKNSKVVLKIITRLNRYFPSIPAKKSLRRVFRRIRSNLRKLQGELNSFRKKGRLSLNKINKSIKNALIFIRDFIVWLADLPARIIFGLKKNLIRLFTNATTAFRVIRKKTNKKKFIKLPKPGVFKSIKIPVSLRIKYIFTGTLLSILFIAVPIIMFFWFSELPNPRLLKNRDIPLTTKIYDRRGILLYQIYANQNRTFIKLNDVPKNLRLATVATEDKNFYKHRGVDVRGIVRAAINNLRNRNGDTGVLQGGSSITQQLIKNALLSNEKTISRKVKEIVLAVWAEFIYSKDEILEMYFNQVPYGGTAWGIEAASETYFGKNARELDLAESALLAGITVAPTLYSPFGLHPELANQRQAYVLKRMKEEGYINSREFEAALNKKLIFRPQTTEIKAPHFVMYIRDLLAKKYGAKLTEQGGLNVTTSLDMKIQDMAQETVSGEVSKIKYLSVGNGAALVVNPKTGEILAMVGSVDYFDSEKDGNVNVTLALRQPGSSIKPVMYAAAFEKGFTPTTIIDDSPVTYNVPGQPPYAPVNYDGKWHGKVTIRNALGSSFNIPAVKVLNAIGVNSMIEMGKKMGITTWGDESRFGLSLTLGGGEVLMTDLAVAYSVFANNGLESGLNPILKITDYKDDVIFTLQDNFKQQAVSPQTAFWISSILSDNNARIMAFGANSLLKISGKTVSVKTGTTNDKRDNWTIGYTPSILTAVWVGNNDNSPMNPYLASGITGAAPIWNKIMTSLLKDRKDEQIARPKEMVAVSVCQWNGMLPCVGCPTITEYFVKGFEPKIHCQITPTPTPTPLP